MIYQILSGYKLSLANEWFTEYYMVINCPWLMNDLPNNKWL